MNKITKSNLLATAAVIAAIAYRDDDNHKEEE